MLREKHFILALAYNVSRESISNDELRYRGATMRISIHAERDMARSLRRLPGDAPLTATFFLRAFIATIIVIFVTHASRL